MHCHRRNLLPIVALLIAACVADDAYGWGFLQGPIVPNRYPVPASYYGYNLDDPNPTYFGGIRYREYYNYGFGNGLANFPGPLPTLPKRGPWQNPPSNMPPPPRHLSEPGFLTDPHAHFLVHLPADAELFLDGVRMQQTGSPRRFMSPALEAGEKYAYTVRARWLENGQWVEKTKELVVHSGAWVSVRFSD